MQQVFKDHQLCKQDSPLGSYVDPYAAEMRGDGYPQQTIELHIRLIADFSQWLAKRRITAREVRAELFQPYLRARARCRHPTGSEFRALQKLLDLLVREGVVPQPAPPAATPADLLAREFHLYLRQERALASTTQSYYLKFVSEFLKERFGTGPVDLSCLSAREVTGFVQRRAANIQSRPQPAPQAATQADLLAREFHLYLRQERALASTTQSYYLKFVSEFLKERFGTGPVDLSCLSAREVTGFVQRRAANIQSRRIQLMTTSLRSFLRFARYRGDIEKDLAACVAAVANWKLSTIPRALPADQVELVLDSINRKTHMGRRDYAILLVLARLGLRAGEIKTLTLEDLDWKEGLIRVRGKGGRYAQLPLPTDVGEAIAEYLQSGRPYTRSRCVFLRMRAPIDGFKGQCGIGSVVKHALARAGVDAPRKGSHQFRHSLATQMLRRGASLSEIGELLRHRSPQTSAIYAKVDLASLSTLALPWPGGAK